MIKTIGIQTLRFLALVFFQVMILNHINLGGYTNPYLYIYFILILPFATPRWLLLLLAFILGLTIDISTHTPGLNAAATVLIAFLRPGVVRILSREPVEEMGWEPSIRNNGFRWFISYAAILVMIHHLTIFYLEIFRLSEFFWTLWRVLISAFLTLVLIIITEFIFYGTRHPD